MIRTSHPQNLKRRIAVIDVPRRQSTRLGVIRQGGSLIDRRNVAGYTTLDWQEPDNAQSWLANIISRQQDTQQNTPGTLVYTPANNTPMQNVAPWNSWVQPNCGDGSPDGGPASSASAGSPSSPGDAIAAMQPPISGLFIAVGLLGAAASAVYLYRSAKGGR